MNVFTEVYDKSVDLLRAPSLDASWKVVETELKALLGTDGPSVDKAGVLDNLRNLLKESGKGKPVARTAVATEIVKACKPGANGFQERAALIKTMQHFYIVGQKGAQSIWVLDPPRGFVAWPYDLLAGKSEPDLKTALEDDVEVFGADHRKMMSDALQLASPSAVTLEKVRLWFHLANSAPADVEASAVVLADGCKLIHAACNSSRVIFSDRPHLRASGEWDNVYASVNAQDVMPVIYIFQVFLETGRRHGSGSIPMLWLCALTVIHELSHKLLRTEDLRYDDQGLRPGTGFTAEQALKNADSWAYFVADLLGAVPRAAFDKVLA
jgi:hypothetical protein